MCFFEHLNTKFVLSNWSANLVVPPQINLIGWSSVVDFVLQTRAFFNTTLNQFSNGNVLIFIYVLIWNRIHYFSST